ncbi:MAG TPA: phosphoribosyltransferase family protein [Marinilabiliaceae bacterium]|nr:phosphoribosyltransferase family protein [Marinilabiliaceae bacterium]
MPQLKESFGQLLQGLMTLTFPQHCYHCQSSLPMYAEVLCRKCEASLPKTGFENQLDNIVFQSFWGRVPIHFATSAFHFRQGETLQKLVHLLKYRNHPEVGLYLGRITGRIIAKSNLLSGIDLVIPVPLHYRRYRKRGYNQCDIIAQGLAETLNVEVISDLLFRSSYNVSQTTKKHYERWQNVEGIFHVVEGQRIQNKRILLIDDIITTGATLEACCTALNETSGVEINVVTVGYTN